MNRTLLSIALLIFLSTTVGAQVSSQNAKRIFSGAAIPTWNCSPGPTFTDFYLRTTTDVLYYCSAAPSTWSVFATGGGGGSASSVFLGPDGTATAPTYSFSSSGNSDNGMFLSAANALGFSTAGVERWTINSSGSLNPIVNNTYDIGNGSVNPRDVNVARSVISPLLIGGSSTTQTLTYKPTTGVGTTGSDHVFVVGNNGATEAFRIFSNGTVAIDAGVAAPNLWGSNIKPFYIGRASFAATTNVAASLFVTNGGYFDGSNWKYNETGAAVSNYTQSSGTHLFRTAVSGTSGNNITWTTGLTITATGISSLSSGANVASAAAIVPSGNVFHVTGTTNVTSITSTGINAGTTITIIFDGVLTFTDGGNLKLAGNFVTSADDSITLVFDGTSWFEAARAVN